MHSGMSINKVEMKLANVFEYGQAYVALSRATSLEGLHIVDFNPKGIRAHPKVVDFYRRFMNPLPATDAKPLKDETPAPAPAGQADLGTVISALPPEERDQATQDVLHLAGWGDLDSLDMDTWQ